MKKSVCSAGLATLAVVLCSCGAAPPPPPETPPYVPSYAFSATGSGGKIDVTVGLVAPQFGDQTKGAVYSMGKVPIESPGVSMQTNAWDDDLAKNFVSGLRTTFNELLSAKGFNVTGPFDSVDNMTFPEKKGADFVLYPEVDVALSQTVTLKGVVQDGNEFTGYDSKNDCELTLSIGGNVLIVVKEPLSGEKMWMKRVEIVGGQSQTIAYKTASADVACTAALSREGQNAKAKLLEDAFKAVMTALDKYVTGEEFQMLKTQATELREKKAY